MLEHRHLLDKLVGMEVVHRTDWDADGAGVAQRNGQAGRHAGQHGIQGIHVHPVRLAGGEHGAALHLAAATAGEVAQQGDPERGARHQAAGRAEMAETHFILHTLRSRLSGGAVTAACPAPDARAGRYGTAGHRPDSDSD